MIRFRIAVEPLQTRGANVVLFGKTSEWTRFMDYLRENGQSVMADMMEAQLHMAEPVNRISLPKPQAQRILTLAGIVL